MILVLVLAYQIQPVFPLQPPHVSMLQNLHNYNTDKQELKIYQDLVPFAVLAVVDLETDDFLFVLPHLDDFDEMTVDLRSVLEQ